METSVFQQYRDYAKAAGKKTFFVDEPCDKCGDRECYTNRKKGRGCVGCAAIASKKQRDTAHADKVRHDALKMAKRESYNRNRPSHNPEALMFAGMKRAKSLHAGVHNVSEWEALKNKADLLKLANGDNPQYTLDHIAPAGGFWQHGKQLFGRTVAENLRLTTIEANKARSNQITDEQEFKQSMYIEQTTSTFDIDQRTTTEELRTLFYSTYGISTRPVPIATGEKLDDMKNRPKREALSEVEALRKAVVLEIWMSGNRDQLEPSEKNPLPRVWDEDKGKMIEPVVRVHKGLHSPEVTRCAVDALNWLDAALHQLDMYKRTTERTALRTATGKPDLKTPSPFGENLGEPDLRERVERHFIEWVSGWMLNITRAKPLYDFVGLVSDEKMRVWFGQYVDELNAEVMPKAA